MTLKELIHEAQNGNPVAQRGLFNRLSESNYSLCLRYVKNEEDAKERMMEGFYKFFRALPDFIYESDAAAHSFVNNIMVNECIQQLRKKRVLNVVAEPRETDAVLEEDGLSNLSAAEIHRMIRRLPDGAREVFNLHAVDGFRHEEIAAILGISIGTSKSQLARAKSLLRQIIGNLKNEDYERERSTQ